MAETPEEREQLRTGLLDQLQYLTREVEMVEDVIARVPENLLAERPPDGSRSIKEIFGLMARLDEAVHLARVGRIVAEERPRFAPADPEALLTETAWREQPVATIFERLRAAREALIDAFASTPPAAWSRTGFFPKEEATSKTPPDRHSARGGSPQGGAAPAEVAAETEERDLYQMAHVLCQRDVDRLRAMTHRLYDSDMGAPSPDTGQ